MRIRSPFGKQSRSPVHGADGSGGGRRPDGASTGLTGHAQAVHRGVQDRFDILGRRVDGSQGHDHVADLLHLQVDAHLPCVLGCDQQRARGGQDLRPAVVEDGYVAGRLSQQLGGDVALRACR